MLILVILILILYYWIFVTFEETIKKPKNITTPVVNLNGDVLDVNNNILFTLKKGQYYDGTNIKGPYIFAVAHDSKQNTLSFTAPDNDFVDKTWSFQVIDNYFWDKDKIIEKDSCFGISFGNVKAEGKMLFDYIKNGTVIYDYQIGNPLPTIFHSDNLFYFKCLNNKIDSLHSCPRGFIFHNKCEKIITCTEKTDGFKYEDFTSKFNYFECIGEKPFLRKCPQGQLFEYDQCIVPDNLCLVKQDGFLKNVDRFSFMKCVNGKPVLLHCPPYTYALNGTCENSVCENKQDDLVPIFITDNEMFRYANKYGKCKNGILVEIFECPTLWDYWQTDVNILQLPQVFHLNMCTIPMLCKNVEIIDPNIIVPQYVFRKHLKNWAYAEVFDLITGFKCDNQGNKIQINVDPGELIIHHRKMKIHSPDLKIPTKDSTTYFNTNNQTVEHCPVSTFFDGFECKNKIANSFTFQHYDIFKFDNLSLNDWITPRIVEQSNTVVASCTGNYLNMKMINACVHKDCEHLQFLYQLVGSIKINDKFECSWDAKKIERYDYLNKYDLKLEFWNQRLSTNPNDICTFGTHIKSGNFILDSTIYMTCDNKQPFVFCPSSSTETIRYSLGTYACIPKRTVNALNAPAKTRIRLSGVSKIEIPANSFAQIGNVFLHYSQDTTVPILELDIEYECDKPSKIYFNRLSTNPENVFIENNNLIVKKLPYDILSNKQVTFLKPFQYQLKNHVTDLSY